MVSWLGEEGKKVTPSANYSSGSKATNPLGGGGGVCIMQPSNVYIQQLKKLYRPTSLCLEPPNVFIQQVKWSASILLWNFLEPSADVKVTAREQSDGKHLIKMQTALRSAAETKWHKNKGLGHWKSNKIWKSNEWFKSFGYLAKRILQVGFGLLVNLHQGGYATNGATL